METENRGRPMHAGAAVLGALVAFALVQSAPWAQSKPPSQAENGTKTPEGAPPGKRPGADNPGAKKPGADRKGPPRRGPNSFAMPVGVDRVVKGPVRQTEPVIGRLVLKEGGVIAASTPGTVRRMIVHVGDRVKKGAPLAELNVDTARARLNFQRAELKIAQQELARFERLRSAESMAFAKAKYEDAQQRVARAEANVRIAEIAIRDATIRAPFPGVVTQRHTDAGAFLNVGAAVVTLVNDTNLEIEVDVPSDRVRGLTPGLAVTCDMDGQTGIAATVRAVVPMQNALTRTVAVRLTPKFGPSSPQRLVNQAITIHVPTGPPRVVVSVHKDAIIDDAGRARVFVVMNGRAVPRMIQLGPAVGSRFEVVSGLMEGDVVVIRGNERLRPGQPVSVRKRS